MKTVTPKQNILEQNITSVMSWDCSANFGGHTYPQKGSSWMWSLVTRKLEPLGMKVSKGFFYLIPKRISVVWKKRNYESLAQSVEHLTFNQGVLGS